MNKKINFFFFLKLQLIFNNKNNNIFFLKKKKILNFFFFLKNVFYMLNYFKENIYIVYYYNYLIKFQNLNSLNLLDSLNSKINKNFLFFFKNKRIKIKKNKLNNYKFIFFLILFEFKNNNIIFFKYFNELKTRFLIFKKNLNLGNYWTTDINKNHELYESSYDEFIQLKNFWKIFEITDDTTRFRLKIDDGIGNDWLFITQYPEVVLYEGLTDSKTIKNNIRFAWENELTMRKSARDFKKVELKIKKLSAIYYKKLEPLKNLNKERLQKVEDLKEKIYNFVMNRRFSFFFKNNDLKLNNLKLNNLKLNNLKLNDLKLNDLKLNNLKLNNLKLNDFKLNKSQLLIINFKNFLFFLKKIKNFIKIFLFKKKNILDSLKLLNNPQNFLKIKSKKIRLLFFFFLKNKIFKKKIDSSIEVERGNTIDSLFFKKKIISNKLDLFKIKKKKFKNFYIYLSDNHDNIWNLKKKKYKFFLYLYLKTQNFVTNVGAISEKRVIEDIKNNQDIRSHLININFLCSNSPYNQNQIFLFTSDNLADDMNFFYQYQWELWLLKIIFLNVNFLKWMSVYIDNDWTSLKKQKKFLNFKNLKYSNFINPLVLDNISYKILQFVNKKRKIQKIARYFLKISSVYFKKIFLNNYFIYLKKINESFFNWKLKKSVDFLKKTLIFELLRENFIKEFLGVCSSTFFTKDPKFLIKWILKILQKLYYKKHWNFLYYLQRNIKKIAGVFIKHKIFSGLHLIIKGKIGAVGSVRKKTIHLKIGRYNFSNFDLKGDYLVSYAVTQTGKIGLKMIICYN